MTTSMVYHCLLHLAHNESLFFCIWKCKTFQTLYMFVVCNFSQHNPFFTVLQTIDAAHNNVITSAYFTAKQNAHFIEHVITFKIFACI